MPHTLASDSIASGKLPPTLTPTGHFAGKPTLPISRSVTLIGSRKQARLQLISSTVSQNHALIVNADSGPYIRDLASRMGIQVNGHQAKELPLHDGDEVQIGRFTFRFNESPSAQAVGATTTKVEPAAPGRVHVEGVEHAVPIDGKSMLIGRRDSSDIHLLEDTVSTTHAIIFEMDGRRYVRDLASRTGTFVNGKQVHQVELLPGDELRIGDSVMQYVAEAGSGATQEEIAPTDLSAEPDDLVELDPQAEPVKRPARPTTPAARPAAPPIAAPAIDDGLELVHDQAEELEPVDLTPTELEAPSAEPADEPAPVQMAPRGVPITPSAFIASPANASDHDDPLAAPLESSLTSAEQATDFHVHDDLAQDDQVELVHLEPSTLDPVAEEDDIVDLEPFTAAAPPTPARKAPQAVAPPPEPIEEEEVELEPFEAEAPQAEIEPIKPAARQAPPAPVAPPPFEEEEVELSPLAAEPELEIEPDLEPAPQAAAPVKPLWKEPLDLPPAAAQEEPAEEFAFAPEPQVAPQAAAPTAPKATWNQPLVPVEDEAEEIELEAQPQPEAAAKAEPEPELEPLELEFAAPPAPPKVEPAPKPVPAIKAPPVAPTRVVSAPVAPAPTAPARVAPAPAVAKPAKPVAPTAPPIAPVIPTVAPILAPAAIAAGAAAVAAGAAAAIARAPSAAPSAAPAAAPAAAPTASPVAPRQTPAAPPKPPTAAPLPPSTPRLVATPPKPPTPPAPIAPVAPPKPAVAAAAKPPVQAPLKPAIKPPAAPPAKAAEAPKPLPLEAFKAPARELAIPAPLDFNQPIPELSFDLPDESAIDAEPETPIASAAPAEAPEESIALPQDDLAAMDFSDVTELPDSIFAAAEEPAYEIPELDFGEDVPQSILSDEAFEIPDLGIEAPAPIAEEPKPAPKAEPIAEEPVAEASPAEPAPPAEVPQDEEAPAPVENRKRPVRKKKDLLETEAEMAPPVITPVTPYVLPRGRAQQPAEPPAARPPVAEATETIEPADATPESAQALDEAIASASGEDVGSTESVELSDSSFGRAVDEFAGDSSEPIVLENETAPQDEVAAEEEPATAAEPESPEVESLDAAPLESTQTQLPPAEPVASSRWGPGSSQLNLEPVTPEPFEAAAEDFALEPDLLEIEPEAPQAQADADAVETAPLAEEPEATELAPQPIEAIEPVEAEADEADLVEVEPEPIAAESEAPVEATEEELAEVEPEPATEDLAPRPLAPAAAERERLFDLEPIETPVPLGEEEEVSLEPVDHLASTPDAEEADIVEVFEATHQAPPAPRTEADSQSFEATDDVETVEHVDHVEAIDADEFALDALDLEPSPLEDLLPAENAGEEIAPLEPPALASGEGQDTLGESQLELEAVEPADVPMAQSQPIADAPPQPAIPPAKPIAPPPQAPQQQQPPPSRSGGFDSFSWGANQEHFFGGMPLRLTPPTGAPKVPLTPAIPMTAAAAAAAAAAPLPQPSLPTVPPVATPAAPVHHFDESGLELVTPEDDAPSLPPQAAPQSQQPPTPQPIAPQIRRPVVAPRTPQQPPAQKGKGIKGSPVATGFDGLAMPPVRETDVFAQNPGSLTAGFAPDLMNDVFAGGSRIGPPTIPPTQPPQAAVVAPPDARPRRASKAEPQGDSWAPAQKEPRQRAASPSASGSHSGLPPAQPPQPPPPRKKRRWFGLKILLLLIMPICMAAAVLGIFSAMPVQSAVTGTLHFTNISDLTEGQRIELVNQQTGLAKNDAIRVVAADQLRMENQPVSFLGDKTTFEQLGKSAKLTDQGDLTVTYTGRKIGNITWAAPSASDCQPMLKILKAIYQADGPRIEQAEQYAKRLDALTKDQKNFSAQVAALQKQLDNLAAATDVPDARQRPALEAESNRLQIAASAAVANAAKFAADLKVLRDNPTAPLPGTAAQPAIPAPPPARDEQLVQWQTDLDQLNVRIAAAKAGQSDKSKTARAQLDDALDAFNQNITQAQTAAKDNPQLLAYVADAQKLLQSTRDLTDQLIKREQDQYAQLSEYKATLNDKMLARRAEVWKKDPELLKLMDQKDIRTRQYNTAVAQGLTSTKEAQDIKADLDYLDTSIRARQTIVADDGFYADTIGQIQKQIDITQKTLNEDRKHTMAAMDDMQATFTQKTPQQLTPDQQQLAAAMGKRLADVTEARKQYTAVTDAASKQADEEVRALQITASQLASKVEARKEQLAAAPDPAIPPAPQAPSAQDFAKAVDQKSAELAAAEKARDETQAAYAAATDKLTKLDARITEAHNASQQHDTFLTQQDSLKVQLAQTTNALDEQAKQKFAAVAPVAPTEASTAFTGKKDQRPLYAAGAVGGIAALCGIASLLMHFTAPRMPAEPTEPDSFAPDQIEFDEQDLHVEEETPAQHEHHTIEA